MIRNFNSVPETVQMSSISILDSRGSGSWEFKSVQETPERLDTAAPIARLESLDELETSQVRY